MESRAPSVPATVPRIRPGRQATGEQASISRELVSGGLKIFDAVTILGSSALAYAAYLTLYRGELPHGIDRYSLVSIVIAAITLLALELTDAYSFQRLRDARRQIGKVATVWAVVCGLGLAAAFVTKTSDFYSRGWAVTWMLSAFALMCIGRLALQYRIRTWEARGLVSRRVAIVGAGEPGRQLIDKLIHTTEDRIRIVGVFDDRATRIPHRSPGGHRVMGSVEDLVEFTREAEIDEIVVALPLSAQGRLQEIFRKLSSLPVDLRLSLDPIAEHLPILGTGEVGGVPVAKIVDKPLKNWSAVLKSIEDKALAAGLLCLFGPLMLLIALLIKLDSRGPVLFVQERFGFNNRVIRVLKFRSMYSEMGDATGARQTVRDDPRVTRVGRWLRASSLDELPQLINVLRGEMSLIGPRAHALRMKAAGSLYHEAVDAYFMRHRVKPGLTGWAQVHGLRGETDTMEKARRRLEYDLWYIDNWSIWLDLKIVLATTRIILKRENAY